MSQAFILAFPEGRVALSLVSICFETVNGRVPRGNLAEGMNDTVRIADGPHALLSNIKLSMPASEIRLRVDPVGINERDNKLNNNKIVSEFSNMNFDHKNEFAALGIHGPLLKAAAAVGLHEPKPIQLQAIPQHLAGRDILGVAQTGSGKTAAFSLPILSKIIALGTKRRQRTARALILAPTRELAVQIEDTIRKLSRGAHVSTALVLGGVSRKAQVNRIKPGIDVLIATPGRLTDLMNTREVDLSETRWLVLDEADRMLDMGFIRDVRRITSKVHSDCQTALFSATMPREVVSLAEQQLKDPVRIEIAKQGTTASEIEQSVVMARTRQKRQVLSNMLGDDAMRSVIVFSRTKHGADRITRDLKRDGYEAAVIHGNKSQNARQAALNGFRDGRVRILVATDIAARGIDVPGISHVINFDLPDEAESYVHRIGRTGRNGQDGIAVTLCDPNESSKLRSVERVIRMRLPVAADHLGEPDPVRPSQSKPQLQADNDRNKAEDQRQPRKRHRKGRRPQDAIAKPSLDEAKSQKANRNKSDQPNTSGPTKGKAKVKKRWSRRKFAQRSAARAA